MHKGKIIKGIAGFYYVYAAGSGIYECKARGIFRKDNRKPLVGDDVMFEILDEKDREGSIETLLPRRNALIRPASANVDQALILFALQSPAPNLMLLDRFLITMAREKIPSLIVFNKCDLDEGGAFEAIRRQYEKAGCPVFGISVTAGEGLDALREALEGRTTVLAGPSGVGKSSLTNALQDEIEMETGAISRKLKRGKNTTRHAQIIPLNETSFLMDTPGFTAFELPGLAREDLQTYYPEMAPYIGRCYYAGCAHVSEPDCAVKEAVREGQIHEGRYQNYVTIYNELNEAEKRRYK